ncbi:MAG TPA: VWA domain-containing protein [Pyrinomonadaceae bacterium]
MRPFSKNKGITTEAAIIKLDSGEGRSGIMEGKRQKARGRREAGLWRILKFCLLVAPLWLALFTPPLLLRGEAQDDTGVRADLPAGGELRIENRRGSVTIEVWNEKQVAVAATIEGKTPARSPVVIQRTEKLLTIGVANAPAQMTARVDLTLRIPERARVVIVTTTGEIDVRGLPASLSVQTVWGDIRANLPASTDADVTAESLNGTVASTLPAASTTNASEHLFQARIGAGGKPVRLRSTRGRIILSATDAPPNTTTVDGARRPPTLSGTANNRPGAGTPADPSATPQEVDEDDVIRVDTELVTLNVSVVDRGTSRGVAGLVQTDFKLYEDGVEQQIAHFDSSAAPFNLVLLIDLSGSTHEMVEIIRAAALRFVEATRPADSISVITFAGTVNLISPLTSDRVLLRQRLNAMDTLPGDTKLYDSTEFAMKEALKGARSTRRTAVIAMSDGLDGTLPSVRGDGSLTISYKDLLDHIREFDGVLYSIWVNTEYESLSPEDTQPEDFDAGHDRMNEMADAGGGMFYEVERLDDLAGAYERVVADLGTVYSLGYRPLNKLRDGKWRSIRVAVARPNAVARGKRGYYAN